MTILFDFWKFADQRVKKSVRQFRLNHYRQFSLLVDGSLRSKFYFIFEFCDHDLAGILRSKIQFTVGHIKSLMQQLLDGITEKNKIFD